MSQELITLINSHEDNKSIEWLNILADSVESMQQRRELSREEAQEIRLYIQSAIDSITNF